MECETIQEVMYYLNLKEGKGCIKTSTKLVKSDDLEELARIVPNIGENLTVGNASAKCWLVMRGLFENKIKVFLETTCPANYRTFQKKGFN